MTEHANPGYLRNLNTFKLRSVLFKIFVSYLSFLVIAFASGSAMFGVISNILIGKEAEINRESLSYAIRLIDGELGHVRDLMYNFLLNDQTLARLPRTDTDIYQRLRVMSMLAKFRTGSRFIDDCWIINPGPAVVIGHDGTAGPDALLDFLRRNHGLDRERAWALLADAQPFHLLTWVQPVVAHYGEPVITMLARASYSESFYKLAVSLKESEILKIIAGTSITTYGSVNVANNDGYIVSSSRSELTGTPAGRGLIERFHASAGAALISLDGNLVVFEPSRFFDGYYYTEIPYKVILKNIDAVRSVFYAAMAVLSLLYIGVAVIYSRFFYRPIAGLLHRFGQSWRAGAEAGAFRDEFARIGGMIQDIEKRSRSFEDADLLRHALESGEVGGDFPERFSGKYFQAALVRYPAGADLFDEIRESLRAGAGHGSNGVEFHVVKNGLEECCILANTDRADGPYLKDRLLAMKKGLQSGRDLSMVIGLGDLVADPGSIRASMQTASVAINQGRADDADQVYERREAPAETARMYFPIDLENVVNNAIVSGEFGLVAELIDRIFEKNANLPNLYLKIVCRELADVFLRLAANHGIACDPNEILGGVEKDYRVERLRLNFRQAYAGLMAKARPGLDTSKRVAAFVFEHVARHFGDPNLSVDLLAEKLGLSPAYVSTLLKKRMGDSFSNYLMGYRFTKAKQMLVETELSVKEISHLVGFRLENSFIRAFRRKVGLSPGEFRKSRGRARP